jgi:hypothetical protein
MIAPSSTGLSINSFALRIISSSTGFFIAMVVPR